MEEVLGSPATPGRIGRAIATPRPWLYATTALVVLLAFLWASDQISLENERTVFTAECRGGAWNGARCTGELIAGARYRFRALRPHGEVVFWTQGGAEPSGKLAPCTIKDGRNWVCSPGPESTRSITLQMAHGRPVTQLGAQTQPFHAVPKWRWWLLRLGIALGHEAES